MPLMGSLYVGVSGLQTSQNALHTTAHNLSNIDTQGYTRQQAIQANRRYNNIGMSYISKQQVGLGVNYAKVRQVRDFFLDKTYRLEAGRTSFYEESYGAAVEIGTLLGEMEGVEFQTSLTDLWSTVEELQKNPTNATNQGLFVSKAASFVERAQAVYNGLASYQDTVNMKIKDTVDTINKYADQIYELNQAIMGIEASGQEEANDLRDARNQLLDELAGYANISYSEDIFGAVSVSLEGKTFVSRTYTNKIGYIQDLATGFYTPVWSSDNNASVFNLQQEISSDCNTDIGGLKALVLLRGSDRGKYTDIPDTNRDYINNPRIVRILDGAEVKLGNIVYRDAPGGTKHDIKQPGDKTYIVKDDGTEIEVNANNADFKQYAEDNKLEIVGSYEDDVRHYNRTVNKSLIQNKMAEFDRLLNGIITGINDILNPVKTADDGTKYRDGVNLFLRTGIDLDQKSEDIPVIEDTENVKTLWTTSNVYINPLLLQQYTYLGSTSYTEIGDDGNPVKKYTTGFMTVDGQEDHSKSDAILDLFANKFNVINPNESTSYNFLEYYNTFVGDMAITGNVYKELTENQADTLESIDASRQQVVGTSDAEELDNMIMFQNAYNASSRYINTVNEMLEHLLNALG